MVVARQQQDKKALWSNCDGQNAERFG